MLHPVPCPTCGVEAWKLEAEIERLRGAGGKMTDIVERLREMSMALCGGSLQQPEASKLAEAAAAEIERLTYALAISGEEGDVHIEEMSWHLEAIAEHLQAVTALSDKQAYRIERLRGALQEIVSQEQTGSTDIVYHIARRALEEK